MAQARGGRRRRQKLVEDETRRALRRRAGELVGLGLIALGGAIATLLWTYSPLDPSFFTATDLPPQNALGIVGAYIADPLHRALGWASFGVAAFFMLWGVRLILHRGEDRAVSRAVLAPVALAIAASLFACHIPPDGWAHSYGLGGLFGDAVLARLLVLPPLTLDQALVVITLAFAFLFLMTAGFTLGFDWGEIRAISQFLSAGAWTTVSGTATATAKTAGAVGRGTVAGVSAARAFQRAQSERAALRRRRAADFKRTQAEHRLNPNIGPDGTTLDFVETAPEPPLARPGPETANTMPDTMPDTERVTARILAAINRRGATPSRNSIDIDSVVIPPPPGHEGGGAPEAVPAPSPIAANAGADAAADAGALVAPLPAAGPDEDLPPPPTARPEPRVLHPGRKPARSSAAEREEQPSFAFDPSEDEVPGYRPPALGLLANPGSIKRHILSDEALEENARMLETVLDDYGVKGEIVAVRPGPVVTMYELEPAPGLKASRVIGLADDIARSMSALAARVSTVPGRSVIGIELPNENREMVLLREILSARAFGDGAQTLPLALGKDISGEPVVANLARMPHLLIAGTTGSGKSVAINTMILSLLYRLGPEACRLIMIDPKMLELSVYDGIPHLLSPVVTDPKKAVVALKWVVAEMEERYRKMSKMGVRNIAGYNARVEDALAKGEGFSRTIQTGFDDATGEPIFETEDYAPEAMPYIVVIVDEMADLMMVAGKEIEACIQRLAQMARASGIHLIMATQRPSVDVITGTIKANFPTRISFQVTSKVDSRTILGEMGAEQLLGQGDMLYMAGGGRITRVHGPFVSDEEVEDVVAYLKSLGAPDYVSGVVEGPDESAESEIDQVLGLGSGNGSAEDALYDQAIAVVARDRKCSTSYVQRKLGIGYNKAARLVERMEQDGVVSPANHVGKREILVPEV